MQKEQSPFEKEVALVGYRLKKAEAALTVVQLNLMTGDIASAYEAAFAVAEASEKLTLAARTLPAYTGHPEAGKRMERSLAESFPIEMGFTPEGWFCVILPALLPKKNTGHVDFIREPLCAALSGFFRGRKPVRFTECVLVFRHVYRRNRPERQYRDHDNIEVNAVADAIALYVLFDDSALRCSHYYCSTVGDEDRTEIFVVPKEQFVQWMLVSKYTECKGVVLREKCP